jgi:DNA-binding NarL/FixJ family response regulator
MPVLDGIATTRRLTAEFPEVVVVVLTTYADDASVLGALRAGARSYLTKDADRTVIAQALHSATAGLAVLDPAVQATLLAAAAEAPTAGGRGTPSAAAPPDRLTRREAQIPTVIARGRSNHDIAAELYLSTHTVKSHINRIFAKTGSPDRTAAVRYAREHGLG